MSSIDNIIIQNGCIIPLSEECNKYVFQDCKNKWITKDGAKLEVKDMTTKHIENSIKMIDKICKFEGLNSSSYKIYKLLNEEYIRRK